MKSYFVVRECSDNDQVYGLLVVEGDVSEEQVDEAICNIKNAIYEEDEENGEDASYTVEDVINDLPFVCEYIQDLGNIEV